MHSRLLANARLRCPRRRPRWPRDTSRAVLNLSGSHGAFSIRVIHAFHHSWLSRARAGRWRPGWRRRRRAWSRSLAAGGAITLMRPCIYISWLSIQHKQGGLRMTPQSMATAYRPLAIERKLIFMHAALFHSGISVCTDVLCVSEMCRVERPTGEWPHCAWRQVLRARMAAVDELLDEPGKKVCRQQ